MANLNDYYNEHYVPNNMILVVGGDFSLASIKAMIKQTFGSVERSATPTVPVFPEPRPVVDSQKIHYLKTSLATINIRFPTVDFGHYDLHSLDLFAFTF